MSEPKRPILIWAPFIFVFLVMAGALYWILQERSTIRRAEDVLEESMQLAEETESEDSLAGGLVMGEPDAVAEPFTLSHLRDAAGAIGITLGRQTPVNGKDNWIGNSDLVILQIIAEGEEVLKTSATVVLNADVSHNISASKTAGRYLDAIVPGTWEPLEDRILDQDHTKDWEFTYQSGGMTFTVSYIYMGSEGVLVMSTGK